MSDRIHKVLSALKHESQSYVISKRTIYNNIHLIRDSILYANISNTPLFFRKPQYQIHKYEHIYIKLTCRFQLPQLLNSFMTSDLNDGDHESDSYLSIIMKNIENISLTSFIFKK